MKANRCQGKGRKWALSNQLMIKPRSQGLWIRLPRKGQFADLCAQLEAELSRWREKVQGSTVTIDAGPRLLSTEELLELEALVHRHAGVRIVQVIDSGGYGEWEEEAEGLREKIQEETPEEEGVTARLVRRTVRSGQRIVASGSLVIVGDVNPGAEVVATGDIIVLGTLRGMAHAGAAGDEKATIIAWRLAPTQLRIAGHIGRRPDGEGPSPRGPERALVQDGMIVIQGWQESFTLRGEGGLVVGNGYRGDVR